MHNIHLLTWQQRRMLLQYIIFSFQFCDFKHCKANNGWVYHVVLSLFSLSFGNGLLCFLGLLKDINGTYDASFYFGGSAMFLGAVILIISNTYYYIQQKKINQWKIWTYLQRGLSLFFFGVTVSRSKTWIFETLRIYHLFGTFKYVVL